MKISLICFVLITSVLLLDSCSSEEPLLDYSFTIGGDYYLPVPIGAKANSWFQKFYETEGQRKLYVLNDDKQRMYVYDIDNGNIEYSFDFIKEGPGAPGEVLGFTVVNQNKLALSSGMRPYSLERV